jgi:hypothetical protein
MPSTKVFARMRAGRSRSSFSAVARTRAAGVLPAAKAFDRLGLE